MGYPVLISHVLVEQRMFQGWNFFLFVGGGGGVTALKLEKKGEGGCKENNGFFFNVYVSSSVFENEIGNGGGGVNL